MTAQSNGSEDEWLVEARSCGDCAVCCLVPPIDTPEFQKQAGVLCEHCDPGRGCRIYARRPSVCREWFCGWRYLDFLPDSLRPDRCGVLVTFDDGDIPAGYDIRPAVRLIVTDLTLAMDNVAFLEAVARMSEEGIPLYLAALGPPKHFLAKIFLSPAVEASGRVRDFARMRAILEQHYAVLRDGQFEPVVLQYGPRSTGQGDG